ncbi:MAG: hypothetical protein IH991_11705, partial [Planctomycetes bacterium]|nr:hypothetical protein [Planctomycetota bacterium]
MSLKLRKGLVVITAITVLLVSIGFLAVSQRVNAQLSSNGVSVNVSEAFLLKILDRVLPAQEITLGAQEKSRIAGSKAETIRAAPKPNLAQKALGALPS